jgi:regulator of nucleoside diphosphate kinase
MSHTGSLGLPPITITTEDLRGLCRLTLTNTAAAGFLARELGRASIVPTWQAMPGFVRMGARVRFQDETDGRVREVTLAYPLDADEASGKLSVLTPVGTALLGLSVGQRVSYLAGGKRRSLLVLDVGR